jgi:Type I restriction enzyme R protein N terminus (HSDR_N)
MSSFVFIIYFIFYSRAIAAINIPQRFPIYGTGTIPLCGHVQQAIAFFKITKFLSASMIKIVYPAYEPKIKKETDKEFIFDEWRKRWVILSPEEWVRQNFLQYLVHVKQYPASLIAIEKEIKLGDLKKRFDIVVYDAASKPWMIIECKEMNVELSKQVLDQVLRYNITMQVPYIVITNGSYCMAFKCVHNNLLTLEELPERST